MTVLICNIGSSDLNWHELPALRGLSERERGKRLLDEQGEFAERLRLPIIEKALRYVQRQPGKLAHVVLIASDQGAEPVEPQARDDWAKDTLFTAQVVAQLLGRGLAGCAPIPAGQIAIWLIGDDGGMRDPADYDGVRAFLERRLPSLHGADGMVFLEVTGGTPAMTTGLLIAGSEVFGERAQALYIHPRHELPATLNTSRRLASGPLRMALRTHAANYNYGAALELLHSQRGTISERLRPGADEALTALLEYAACRFNFDFQGARAALEGGPDRAGDGRWRPALQELYHEVHMPDRLALLAEVYHGAAARYDAHAFADFLTQVVRFQENAFRALCVERGAQFVDFKGRPGPHGALLKQSWADAVGFTARTDRPDGAHDKLATRTRLGQLVAHLALRRGEHLEPQITALGRLDELAKLRNNLTHSLDGVRKIDLARAFAGDSADPTRADEIAPHLAATLELVVGRAPGDSPYRRINSLIDDLLREA